MTPAMRRLLNRPEPPKPENGKQWDEDDLADKLAEAVAEPEQEPDPVPIMPPMPKPQVKQQLPTQRPQQPSRPAVDGQKLLDDLVAAVLDERVAVAEQDGKVLLTIIEESGNKLILRTIGTLGNIGRTELKLSQMGK